VKQSASPGQFHEIVREYSGYVYTIAFRMLGNGSDAEDVAQETFIKAFRKLDTYDAGLGMKNWLCTIALNTARDWYRKKGRRRDAAGEEKMDEESSGGEETSVHLGNKIDIEKMLSVLDIRYRSVMVLYYMEQYGTKEIAQMLKKSESAVKIWLFRARKILMEKFGDSFV